MGIRTADCDEGSILREYLGRRFFIPAVNGAGGTGTVVNVAAAIPVNATPMTIAQARPHWPYCLSFTWSVTLASTLQVVGKNQFGEDVTEIVTNTGGGEVLVHTLNAYESITSITPLTGAWAAITVGVGWSGSAGTGKMGLPFRIENANDIIALSLGTLQIAPPTVDAVYHTIVFPVVTNFSATAGCMAVCHFRPDACYKY